MTLTDAWVSRALGSLDGKTDRASPAPAPHPSHPPPCQLHQQLTKIEDRILYLTGVSRTWVLRTEENRRYVLPESRELPKTEIFQSPPDPFPPPSPSAARGHLITRPPSLSPYHHHHHHTIFYGGHLFAEISMSPDNGADKNTPLCPPPLWGFSSCFLGQIVTQCNGDVSHARFLISMGKITDNRIFLKSWL